MGKEYVYRRRGIPVATVTKYDDGSAFLDSAVHAHNFDKAIDALITVRAWLEKMDFINGWDGLGAPGKGRLL